MPRLDTIESSVEHVDEARSQLAIVGVRMQDRSKVLEDTVARFASRLEDWEHQAMRIDRRFANLDVRVERRVNDILRQVFEVLAKS